MNVSAVRAYGRLIAIVVWTAFMYLCMAISNLALHFAWERRLHMQTALIKFWARRIIQIANIHLTVRGTPPTPPFIQVSNHLTYIDMVVMWAVQGCAFVSRDDLQNWPVMGRMSKNLNTIYINREDRRDTKRVNEKIAAAYDKGIGMHIFVEGRISQDGEVAEFKAPLLEPAVAKGVPVHYAALSYKTPKGCPNAKDVVVWKNGVTLAQNIMNILALPGVEATASFGDQPLAAEDRKTLANKLRHGVIEQFIPMD